MTAAPRVLVVGENNPYSRDPRCALLYWPAQSAGARLRRAILGMRPRDYLRAFDRRNLLSQLKWSAPAAREAAAKLRAELKPGAAVILLGRKVHDAWYAGAIEWRPFWTAHEGVRNPTLTLPHPSGLSRAWNAAGSYARARRAVAELAPHLAPYLGVDHTPHKEEVYE